MPSLTDILADDDDADGPLLGCFPLYPPVELFHAMGLRPVVLWGLRDLFPTTPLADLHLQSYTCSVARRLTEAVLADPTPYCGLFAINSCDTLRNLPEILEQGTRGRTPPLLRMHAPAVSREQTPTSVAYLEARIDELIGAVSSIFGVRFSRRRFEHSVAQYREMRRLALEAEEVVAESRASFRALQELALAGAYSSVSWQIEALRSFLDGQRARREPGRRVALSGILPPPGAVTDIIEAAGLTVVANDIALMHRSWAHTPECADPAQYYVDSHWSRFPCTTALHASDRRVEAIEGLVGRSGARGLIFIGEKFCECEHLELPYLEERLRRLGVRTLVLEVSQECDAREQTRTRVEAFAEILG
jgi:benzoyl-CoA reductase/2-hydroxyglutaryl-CoA dehydratase subunit BcrC/BadD/HgdB